MPVMLWKGRHFNSSTLKMRGADFFLPDPISDQISEFFLNPVLVRLKAF